jgi:manganese oxidase
VLQRILSLTLIFSFILAGCSTSHKGKHAEAEEHHKNQKADKNELKILTDADLRKLPPLPETNAIKPTGNVREYTLVVKKGKWEVVSGTSTDAITINGQVPGPTIRATEGDTIRVTLKNQLSEATSIHWHGIHLPNKMDGVPSFTQHAVQPGKSFTYEFIANHAGTYMYHSHFNSIPQIDKGMYGLLIIDPQDRTKQPKYDKEYAMIFGGWHVPGESENGEAKQDHMQGMSAGTEEHMKRKGNIPERMEKGQESKKPMHNQMNHMNKMTNDQAGGPPSPGKKDDAMSSVMEMDYNYWTINGKSFPDTEPMIVKIGDRVRIRLANISNGIHPMHMHGHDFRIIAKDGHPLQHPQIVNTVTVNPGETYDIDFIANNPGEWLFHCHELHHTTNADVEPGGLISVIKYVKK